MKKTISFVILITGFSVFGQMREKGTIELAPVIGIGFANYYSGDAGSENKSITDVNFGVSGDYYFNNRWSLRSALMYQVMGSRIGGFEDQLSYITVPLNANWHFGSTRKWHLNFGPSVSFLTKAETTIEGETFDVKDDVESFQIGLSYGIGYKFEVTPKFGIDISYNENLGLTDVPKSNEFSFKNSHSAFNLSAIFMLD